jgi:hypothetical protein
MSKKKMSDLNDENENIEFVGRNLRIVTEFIQTQWVTLSPEEKRKVYLSYPEKTRLEYERKLELKRLNEPDKLED